jgi:IS30 family transposase
MVSHERIYQYVWRNKKDKGDLYKRLRSYTWGKRKRLRLMQQPVPDRKFIGERLEVGKAFGDWEIDTMKGRQGRHSLLTMVDRYSKYTIIRKLRTYKPNFVSQLTVEELKKFGPLNRTITSDNGFEICQS